MNIRITTMYIIIGLLLVIVAILFVRIFQYKNQMRLFAKRINKRKSYDVNQIVTVEYFDKDVVNLAVALNEYTDMVKEKTHLIEEERKQLKNVIAGISHDFRTPLTAAKGYMQLIKKSGKLDERTEEYLDIALSKTDYLKELSDAFFEVSSMDAKDNTVELTDINITNLLSEICLGQYEGINEKGIVAKINIPEQDILIESNEEMLKRIFENLFSNSIKYSKTYLNIDLSITMNEIAITFANDVESETHIDIVRVFEAFYRDESRHSEGAGLGLYVVNRLSNRLSHIVTATYDNNIFTVTLRIRRK